MPIHETATTEGEGPRADGVAKHRGGPPQSSDHGQGAAGGLQRGFTAASPHLPPPLQNVSVYTAPYYPREYCERHAFIPNRRQTSRDDDDSDRRARASRRRYGWNIVRATTSVGAIDAQVGPGRARWVIDWYAFIVKHKTRARRAPRTQGNAYETDLRARARPNLSGCVHEAKEEKQFR